MTGHLWTIPINYILLPLIFFFLALLVIKAMEILEAKLPEKSRLRIWLSGQHYWKNPHWLRDRIDLIVTILLTVLLVIVTIAYS